ncbi:Gfo/Idh/MocA family protein [Paenibacillus sinopodophylli]|uniref:Gfo/Idh/MocA family protein n=1 Tax=Paenibacillus sinopodophylli TaxID=1837342 RepID=UPI00110CC97C|nr:Gfo/Idh/MocA family oxidoreductase [Paenibacillus sinopodophylli]
MPFKICVVGCGSIAWRGHGPAYRRYAAERTDTELAACVDTDLNKAGAFAKEFGFARTYSRVDEALASERPDVVCLLVPAPHIALLAISILEQGYPLLLEKPPGVSKDEAERIADAAQQPDGSELPNRVAFNRRYMPLVIQARGQLNEWSADGKIHHIAYDISRVGRTDDEDASVTIIHGIDALRELTGSDYREVRMQYKRLPHLGADVTNVALEGEFLSGVTFSLNYYPAAGAVYERAQISGEGVSLRMKLPFWTSHDSPGSLELWSNNECTANWKGEAVAGSDEAYIINGFYEENAGFFDDIRAGRKPVGGIASAIQTVEVAEAVYRRAAQYVGTMNAGIGEKR